MKGKPEIVFTFPACMGGVTSFNFNLINNSRLIKTFHSKVIMLQALEDKRVAFKDTFLADEVITFRYSKKENGYYVQKRLNMLLGNAEGAIVTDNALTITAAGLFRNPKTVYQLVHDFFYVKQSLSMGDLVDVAIAHSSFFSDAVFASNPHLFAGRTFYIPYGVQQCAVLPIKSNSKLNLVFLGRLDEGKGVLKLHEMDMLLNLRGVDVGWSIIGKGPLKQQLLDQWKNTSNVEFFEPDLTSEVYEILARQDIMIFPTVFEGTPVSILECIANGVMIITNDLPGGIRDIVQEGIGHRCELNNINQFVEHICYYHFERDALKEMQKNCFSLARNYYDVRRNADNYFEKFGQFKVFKRTSQKAKIKTSKLDRPLFNNKLVQLIRNITN